MAAHQFLCFLDVAVDTLAPQCLRDGNLLLVLACELCKVGAKPGDLAAIYMYKENILCLSLFSFGISAAKGKIENIQNFDWLLKYVYLLCKELCFLL